MTNPNNPNTSSNPGQPVRFSGWEQQNAAADANAALFHMRRLTAAEVADLQVGHSVANPQPMQTFQDADEFKLAQNQNNFWTLFGSDLNANTYMITMRRGLGFQRLEVVRPDLVAALTFPRGPFDQMPDEYYRQLYEAYNEITRLTSRDDPEIQAQPTETARERFWLG